MSIKDDKVVKIIASGPWPINVAHGDRSKIAKETKSAPLTVRLALGGLSKTKKAKTIRKVAMVKYNGYCPEYKEQTTEQPVNESGNRVVAE